MVWWCVGEMDDLMLFEIGLFYDYFRRNDENEMWLTMKIESIYVAYIKRYENRIFRVRKEGACVFFFVPSHSIIGISFLANVHSLKWIFYLCVRAFRKLLWILYVFGGYTRLHDIQLCCRCGKIAIYFSVWFRPKHCTMLKYS